MKKVRIRACLGEDLDPELEIECSFEDWEKHAYIYVPGFTTYYSVDIRPVWKEFHSSGKATRGEATGYETIVKFGDTMQLKRRFTVLIESADRSSRGGGRD